MEGTNPTILGAIRLTAAEMAALVDGLDWQRVHVPRETVVPRLTG